MRLFLTAFLRLVRPCRADGGWRAGLRRKASSRRRDAPRRAVRIPRSRVRTRAPATRRCAGHEAARGAAQKTAEPPARPDLTAADQDAAIIPISRTHGSGPIRRPTSPRMLPTVSGPWINLSTGGGDGAFGAGLLERMVGVRQTPAVRARHRGQHRRADGAVRVRRLRRWMSRLKRAYTEYNAGDIFEDVKTPESLVDTWPLKRLIAKEVTPELLAAVAEGHKAGRRLFVATTNLDASRGVVWNMGAIAARGDEAALKLFRDILLASTAIPGPVSAGSDRRRDERKAEQGDARRRRACGAALYGARNDAQRDPAATSFPRRSFTSL